MSDLNARNSYYGGIIYDNYQLFPNQPVAVNPNNWTQTNVTDGRTSLASHTQSSQISSQMPSSVRPSQTVPPQNFTAQQWTRPSVPMPFESPFSRNFQSFEAPPMPSRVGPQSSSPFQLQSSYSRNANSFDTIPNASRVMPQLSALLSTQSAYEQNNSDRISQESRALLDSSPLSLLTEHLKSNDAIRKNSLSNSLTIKLSNDKDADSVVKVIDALRDALLQYNSKRIDSVNSSPSLMANEMSSESDDHYRHLPLNNTFELKTSNNVFESIDEKSNDMMSIFAREFQFNDIRWDKLKSSGQYDGKSHRTVWKTAVFIDGREFIGFGKNKKNAKNNAAIAALKEFGREVPNLRENPKTDYIEAFHHVFKGVQTNWGRFSCDRSNVIHVWKKFLKIGDREFVGVGSSKMNAKQNAAKSALEEVQRDPSLLHLRKDVPQQNIEAIESLLIDYGLTIVENLYDNSTLENIDRSYYCEFCRSRFGSLKGAKHHIKRQKHIVLRSMNMYERNRIYTLFDENLQMREPEINCEIEFTCVRCKSYICSNLTDAEMHIKSYSHRTRPNVVQQMTLENGQIYYNYPPKKVTYNSVNESDDNNLISSVRTLYNPRGIETKWNIGIQIGNEIIKESGRTKGNAVGKAIKKYFRRRNVRENLIQETNELFENTAKDWNAYCCEQKESQFKWKSQVKTEYGTFKGFGETEEHARRVARKHFLTQLVKKKKSQMKSCAVKNIRI